MKVNFYGTYRLITGEKTIYFPVLPGSTLLHLLHAVTVQFPALKHEMLDEHGNLYSYIPLFINGRNPRLLENGIFTAVTPEAVLSIFSPISSGRINVEEVNQTLSG